MLSKQLLIECQDCSFGWEGNTVIHALNFGVLAGDYLCITGENGSGKSTLLQGLLGLKPARSGLIKRAETLRACYTGYLPQRRPGSKDFPAGVYEVVLSGCLGRRALPFYRKKDKQRAAENMERLGIAELRNCCYGELSGGQQQRVLLARALCAAEQLLVLDEPAAGLDPLVSAEMYGIVQALNREEGLTVIMVSHDVQNAVGCANKLLHLGTENAGNTQLFFGTTEDFRRSDSGKTFLAVCQNEVL